jgi:hypothetical protein
MATTDHLEKLEDLLNFAIECLENYSGWTVEKFPGSNADDLFNFIPELELPAAVVTYKASSYGDKPRRISNIEVIVASEFYSDSSNVSSRVLIEKVVELLDKQISGHALFKVKSDEAMNLGNGICSYSLKVEVEDH